MIWFERTTTLTQSIFSFPVIGQITGHQAVLILCLGMPMLFGTLHMTENLPAAAGAFCLTIIFAMIRPPVISYEGRIWCRLQFMLFGPKTKSKSKKTGKTKKSNILSLPSKNLSEQETVPEPIIPEEEEVMRIDVKPESQVMVGITLRTKEGGVLARKKVQIALDGMVIKNTMSSSTGICNLLLDSEDCIGNDNIIQKKKISVRDVTADGNPGEILVSKKMEFVPI